MAKGDTLMPTKAKPVFGSNDGNNYAVNVDGVDNGFFKQSFGRQIDDIRRINAWKDTAKKGHVDAKGKPTKTAVRRWVNEVKPREFYAQWKSDSASWKDDSVEIYYTV